MSKNPTRRPTSNPTHPPQAAHGLDETITDLTVKTRKGLQQHWKLLLIALVGVFIVIAYQKLMALRDESNTKAAHGKIFDLTGAKRSDEDPDINAMRALLTELENDVTEKSAFRTIVAFLIQRGNEALDGEEEDPEIQAKKTKFYAAAGEFADLGATRFPDDEDMQTWAKKVGARVKGETDQSWLPSTRSYKLKLPEKTSAPDAPTTDE